MVNKFQKELFYLSLVFKFAFSSNDWCNMKTCFNPSEHILCLHRSRGVSDKCPEVKITTNDRLRATLLHLHNNLRNKWAEGEWKDQSEFPKASDMQVMFWDYEIEELAQRVAENCLIEETCRSVERFAVGQNRGYKMQNRLTIASTEIFNEWVEEFSLLLPSDITIANVRSTAKHFSQCIWSRSRALGCAESLHYDHKNAYEITSLICNYGPVGNIAKKSVYNVGEPCTYCPKRTKCSFNQHYPTLCGGDFPEDAEYKDRNFRNTFNEIAPKETNRGDREVSDNRCDSVQEVK